MNEDDLLAVEAFHDGELVGMARRRLERRLRNSPELRAELDELAELSALLVADPSDPPVGTVPASLGTWQAIAGALPAIDAQVEEERRLGAEAAGSEPEAPAAEPGGFAPWAWATAVGAAIALALALAIGSGTGSIETPASPPPLAAANPIAVAGAVRYLDTSGRSVMVIEEVQEDLTILWMMDEA